MLHPLSFVKLPAFFLFYVIAFGAQAQVFNTSVSGATGGTGRAAVQAGDAMYLNAATLAHLRGRHIYFSANEDAWMGSLSDNTGTVIPASLGFIQNKTKALGQDVKQQNISLAVADFVMDRLTIGITGHYLQSKLDITGSYQQTNADIGLLYTAAPALGVGLVVYNAFGEKNDIPEEIRLKTTAALGLNYVYKEFIRLRFDISSDPIYMAGFESYVSKWTIIRFGFQDDTDKKRKLWTGGFGFEGPKFGLSYAYQGNPDHSSDYRHSVDLQIPF
ncbi:hypothetical protein D3C87_88390 [compost metagenome]